MTFTPAARNAAEYQERAHDELKQIEIHPYDLGAIVLDTFMAMAQDDRRAVWALASDADKRGLALQIIRRKNHGPDEATIAIYLEQLEVRFGSDQLLPSAAEILASAKERADTARHWGDFGGARQLDRVRMNVTNGARLTWHLGDLLVSSVNTPGAVYSVNQRGCTCPNGAAGKANCWHVALFDLLLEMAEDRAAARDMLADAAAYRAEQDEDGAPTPTDLGSRLARARACYLVAA